MIIFRPCPTVLNNLTITVHSRVLQWSGYLCIRHYSQLGNKREFSLIVFQDFTPFLLAKLLPWNRHGETLTQLFLHPEVIQIIQNMALESLAMKVEIEAQ